MDGLHYFNFNDAAELTAHGGPRYVQTWLIWASGNAIECNSMGNATATEGITAATPRGDEPWLSVNMPRAIPQV